MPKMKAFDVIKVHVHDDGDVELEKHVLTGALDQLYPFDLKFYITKVVNGALQDELISYGCEADRVKEAIEEVMDSEYHTTVTV